MKAICFIMSLVLAFSAGLQLREPLIVEKPVLVQVPVFHDIQRGKYFGAQQNKIAAVIPASALRSR